MSVVIPSYNSGQTLREAVESVLSQTLKPRQVIVVDDGSTDDTEGLMSPFADRIEYHKRRNAGPSATRNAGVRLSTQPFIAFLDADDVWHPQKLELQMWHLENDQRVGLLATDFVTWPREAMPELSIGDARGMLCPVTWEQLVVRANILTSSVVVRKELLLRAGEFDATLCGPEDRDMFLRLAEICCLSRLALPLVGYRDSPLSLTKDAGTCEAGMRRILGRLDDRMAWRGRRMLRRKAYSFVHHSVASVEARAGHHWAAVSREFRSLAIYPVPYTKDDVGTPFERIKRIAVNGLRGLHLKATAAQRLRSVQHVQSRVPSEAMR